MKGRKLQSTLIFAAIASLLLVIACKKKETPPSAPAARVAATKAYERYFGPAPTTDKGTCYAFVIYFPSAKEPGKIVPFPFFTFDEGSIKKVAVARLLGGMEVESYKGEILQPFPPGTRLLGLLEGDGAVTANFSKEVLASKADEAAEKAMLNALSLTLSQFPGVREVRMHIEGNETGTVGGRIVAEETAVMQPSPPRLLSVTAVKDKGAKDVEEVSAYFDRPVEVQEFFMTDQQGRSFAGDVYHSVFDMAAVLKPKDPGLFKERMPIKIRWKVTDKLGRHAEGDNVWLLEVKEH